MAQNFAISAGHRHTAEAGAEVLRAGGNAVDGVLAAAFTAFMAEPIMAQPYGGGFLLVQQKGESAAHLIDFYGSTPRVAPPREDLDNHMVEANFGQTKQTFYVGAGTIAVSGLAQGFSEAMRLFGTMSLLELAAQGISLARRGLVLDQRQADIFQVVGAVLASHDDGMTLYGTGERLLEKGERWQNEALGNVMECWAQEGARFMSEGEAARAVLELTAERGAVRAHDLRDYRVEHLKPLGFTFRGKKIFVNPPPSAGGVLIRLALALLEEGGELPRSPVVIAHALAAVYQVRQSLGHLSDPSKSEQLLAADVLADLRARPKSWRGTTHISAIDKNGLGASLSLTNGAGSGLIAHGTGIHLNDMLGEPELIPAAVGNMAFPENVRLCSMMSPTISSSEDDFLVLGAAGSTRIPSAIIQTLLPLLAGASCHEALAKARLHYEGKLMFEDFFTSDEREALLDSYPDAETWDERAMFFGGVNVARSHVTRSRAARSHVTRSGTGELEAGGDTRRDSVAIVE